MRMYMNVRKTNIYLIDNVENINWKQIMATSIVQSV